MLAEIAKWTGEQFNLLRKYYNGFEVLELLGLLFGIGIVITVFALGIAAIVASGGTAVLVIGVMAGVLASIAMALNNYTNLFRAIGIAINLLIDKTPSNYEKMGTVIGLLVGVVAVIALISVGWPLAVPLLAGSTTVLPWMLALIAVPLTLATFQGGGRFLGRQLDRYGPRLKKDIQFEANDRTISSDVITLKVLTDAKLGIDSYKELKQNQLDDWQQHFDWETGANRSDTYLSLLKGCTNELQQAIILYTMLTSYHGETLQEKVVNAMNIENKEKTAAALGQYIHDHAREKDISFIKESLIEKLHLFANAGEVPDFSQSKYRELVNNFKDIKPRDVTLEFTDSFSVDHDQSNFTSGGR